MERVIGPLLKRDAGYGFDVWSPAGGLARGWCYRRMEDARYARNAEIAGLRHVSPGDRQRPLVCDTADDFMVEIGQRQRLLLAA